jgi:H+/Cl- antiporter ClcA
MVINKLKSFKEKITKINFYKDLSLALCLFFNPFGFDVVQYYLMEVTGSIWRANLVMYCIAGLFFGLYIYLSKLLKREI